MNIRHTVNDGIHLSGLKTADKVPLRAAFDDFLLTDKLGIPVFSQTCNTSINGILSPFG